jgi:nitric oxide reductase NorQ protein
MPKTRTRQYRIEEYVIKDEPFYVPSPTSRNFRSGLPATRSGSAQGPTGTGKTRFVEYMAWKLGRPLTIVKDGDQAANGAFPLVTVACHEDLSASDLVGRYLLDADGTRWIDGPLTRAVKTGGICYLDEVVEARKDTTVIIHPLTDHRRLLTIDKLGEVVEAAEGFLLVVSYNPGYQNVLKDLKHSTRQASSRSISPEPEREAKIIAHESGADEETMLLAKLTRATCANMPKEARARGADLRRRDQGRYSRGAPATWRTWGITDDLRQRARPGGDGDFPETIGPFTRKPTRLSPTKWKKHFTTRTRRKEKLPLLWASAVARARR